MLRDLLNWGKGRELVELVVPRRTFADVILPEKTRRMLADTLMQIEKYHLIFEQWGLGERHNSGTGLVFNFAGPPGTGKTICAEAVANALGKRLLRVRYSEMESCFLGETGKNIASVFRDARQQDAVLFFDEADSVASRRFTTMQQGAEREANQAVNILLKELESYEGVVIFATNLSTNFDPAFERRVRTHIVFEMPGASEREMIWKVQVHPQKTPLAPDVDFHALAAMFEVSGGDIKNAVLKAAHIAASQAGPDHRKLITQAHFVEAMEQVLESRKAMEQSVFGDDLVTAANGWAVAATVQGLDARLQAVEERAEGLAPQLDALRSEVETATGSIGQQVGALQQEVRASQHTLDERIAALSTEWGARLQGATLLKLPRWAAVLVGLLLAAAGGVAGHFLR